MRMIAGFEHPTSGDIRIRGQSMIGVPPNRRPVNMVFQSLALFPMMSVGENVAYGLTCRGVSRAEAEERAGRMLERVGLKGFGDRRVTSLSGGQQPARGHRPLPRARADPRCSSTSRSARSI